VRVGRIRTPCDDVRFECLAEQLVGLRQRLPLDDDQRCHGSADASGAPPQPETDATAHDLPAVEQADRDACDVLDPVGADGARPRHPGN
jgi:hypothetical protein